MPSLAFWKKRKPPKMVTSPVREPEQMHEMSQDYNLHSVHVEDNWRPSVSAASDGKPRSSRNEQSHVLYDSLDAFGTMHSLLSGEGGPPPEIPDEAPEHFQDHPDDPYAAPAQPPRRTGSLSTVSASQDVGNESNIGTVQEIDALVRRSMNTRGQAIPVGIVDPYAHYPPLPGQPDPPILHRSYAAEPVTAIPQVNAIPQVEALQVPEPANHQSSYISYTPPRNSVQQSMQEVPNPFGISELHESPSEFGSHRPFSPIHNLPRGQGARDPLSRTNTNVTRKTISPSGSFHSLTYQRALKEPTPIADPLPNFNPRLTQMPRPLARSNTAVPIPAERIGESGGRALVEARKAFYGTHRPADERFYWTLPPNHDERVVYMLDWVYRKSWPLASLGVHKFLATRSLGALVVNVEYHESPTNPLPVVDWITFADAQRTLDKVLQESIATYDPATTTLVFAFLMSKSRNSIGIWRRKLPVPDDIQALYASAINKVKAEMNWDDVVVHVEATVDSPPGTFRNAHNARRYESTEPLYMVVPPTSSSAPPPFEPTIQTMPLPRFTPTTMDTAHDSKFGTHRPSGPRLHVFGRSPS
ncbi:hypothetical protein FRB99_001109, partial [Tulasnella sp. 403]